MTGVPNVWPGGVQGGAAAPVFLVNDLGVSVELVNTADAFGRLRTAQPVTRTDFTFTYDKQPMAFDEIITGSGAATHNANLRAVLLSTGGNGSGAGAKLTQRFYAPYTPGNSQYIVMTGNLNYAGLNAIQMANIRAEIGYGDAANGVGFLFDAQGAAVFLRTSVGGAPAETVIYQADWNQNTALSVDWTKSQIFIIDFQSLAVGRIRFYLDRAGVAVLVHEIYNDNVRSGPYWQIGSAPPYWSVINTGVAGATGQVLAICCTVKSEGGEHLLELPGFHFAASNDVTPVTVSNSMIPVLSIQIKTTFNSLTNRGLVIPTLAGFSNDNPIHYHLVLNPTLTGASFTSVDAQSLVNVDRSASALSNGRIISEGYVGSGTPGAARAAGAERSLLGKIPLSVNALGTIGDILTVAAERVGSQNAATTIALEWKEIR